MDTVSTHTNLLPFVFLLLLTLYCVTSGSEKPTWTPPLMNYTNNADNISHPYDIDFKELVKHAENNEHINLKPINNYNFKYILNPKLICKNPPLMNRSVLVLVLIKSAPDNFHLRQMLRLSLEQSKDKVKYKEFMRIVFLLGTSSKELNKNVLVENALYEDIVQQNFVDSYRNLTHKSVMGYNWAVKYCPSATHILYKDDDFFFNVEHLMNYLALQSNPKGMLRGYRTEKAPPSRNKNSPHYVSHEEYAPKLYPPYLSGGAYIISMDVAKQFVLVFPYIKYISVDDSYLGIVAMKLGIEPQKEDKLISFNNCKDLHTKVMACRGYTSKEEIFAAWKMFVKRTLVKFYL